MYTKEEIDRMSAEEAKEALWAAQLSAKATSCAGDSSTEELKNMIQEQIVAVLQTEQGTATSFTKNFLVKHQVSPQIAGAIAVSAIGGFLEIMKALLLLWLK